MWKPTRYKPAQFEAIQFVYNKECIEALEKWVGSGCTWGKNRHMGAIGWFSLPNGMEASEHEYIVKVRGEFTVICPDIMDTLFDIKILELDKENVVDNSYEP